MAKTRKKDNHMCARVSPPCAFCDLPLSELHKKYSLNVFLRSRSFTLHHIETEQYLRISDEHKLPVNDPPRFPLILWTEIPRRHFKHVPRARELVKKWNFLSKVSPLRSELKHFCNIFECLTVALLYKVQAGVEQNKTLFQCGEDKLQLFQHLHFSLHLHFT